MPPDEGTEGGSSTTPPGRVRTVVTRMGLLRARSSTATAKPTDGGGTMCGTVIAVVRGRDEVTLRELKATGIGLTYAAMLATKGAIRRV